MIGSKHEKYSKLFNFPTSSTLSIIRVNNNQHKIFLIMCVLCEISLILLNCLLLILIS